MQDSKDLKVDKKNDDSEMLESDAKEDELDTLEKEYNAEYCVDSDGLQRFGENGTSDSADMSDGSDTDCTNKSGSDKMSRVKLPEQDADPQAMRGGGVKEINNIDKSDPNEVFAGIKVKGNPLMTTHDRQVGRQKKLEKSLLVFTLKTLRSSHPGWEVVKK